jgi:hypothetical protein
LISSFGFEKIIGNFLGGEGAAGGQQQGDGIGNLVGGLLDSGGGGADSNQNSRQQQNKKGGLADMLSL